MGVPQTANTSLVLSGELPEAASTMITDTGGLVSTVDGVTTIGSSGWVYFSFSQYFGGTGLFAAMIFGFISVLIYAFLMKKNIIIKLPDSVPPAILKAFAAIIPGTLALYACGIIYSVFENVFGQSLIDWISESIQAPLLNLSQGYAAVILITLLVHVLWVFGLHGTNIMGAVLQSVYGVAMTTNSNAFQSGLEVPYKWVAGVLWVMPPVLSGFLATAGDWRAIILSLINLAVGILIWAPFVIGANRTEIKSETEVEVAVE